MRGAGRARLIGTRQQPPVDQDDRLAKQVIGDGPWVHESLLSQSDAERDDRGGDPLRVDRDLSRAERSGSGRERLAESHYSEKVRWALDYKSIS